MIYVKAFVLLQNMVPSADVSNLKKERIPSVALLGAIVDGREGMDWIEFGCTSSVCTAVHLCVYVRGEGHLVFFGGHPVRCMRPKSMRLMDFT